MFRRWLPREVGFFDIFEKHAAITLAGALELEKLLRLSVNTHKSAIDIKELEHQADGITQHCIEELHRTFITPLDREDIYLLICRMDDILDAIEEASSRIDLYKIQSMRPEAGEMGKAIVQSVIEIDQIMKELRNMKNAQEIRNRCQAVNLLENHGDRLHRSAVARLFNEEPDTRLLIKWKEIFDYLEETLDRCEDVVNIIEGIVMEMA